MTALRLAFGLLSRIPMGDPGPVSREDLARAAALYPLVGAVLGALCAGVLLGLRMVVEPDLASALLIPFALLLTGGLHEDGLADTADGLGGGRTRERALEIMKDSRIGAYGAMALVAALILRFQLFTEVEPLRLVAAGALSRWAALALGTALPAAREGGLAAPILAGLRLPHLALGTALALGAAVVAPAAAGLALLATAVCGLWWRRALGGVTGDLLGATVVIVEFAVLLAP